MENSLELIRKRLIMRAEHRGIKEMDIILGGFVRANVETWDAAKISHIESLMEIDDQSLYAMICGHVEMHSDFQDLLKEIKDYIKKP